MARLGQNLPKIVIITCSGMPPLGLIPVINFFFLNKKPKRFFFPVYNPNLSINQLKPEPNLQNSENIRAETKPEQKIFLILNLN